MSERMIQVSAGTGPIEVRRLVRRLADALAARLAARGVEVGAIATVGDPEACRLITSQFARHYRRTSPQGPPASLAQAAAGRPTLGRG
jgi:hypothetical protein